MKITKNIRTLYLARLCFRILVLLFVSAIYFWQPESFAVLDGWNFFFGFSVLHILWVIWVFNMLLQLMPSRRYLTLGAQKQFLRYYMPPNFDESSPEQKSNIKNDNRTALKILIVWAALTAAIGGLKGLGIIDKNELFLISALFYVLDLVFVLYWCPFKAWFLKNKCCTTCRIFNWDHLMMFSPIVFVSGFYSISLFAVSVLVFIAWEMSIILHPERFTEGTNKALKCQNCTDMLCGGKNCDYAVHSNPNRRQE